MPIGYRNEVYYRVKEAYGLREASATLSGGRVCVRESVIGLVYRVLLLIQQVKSKIK